MNAFNEFQQRGMLYDATEGVEPLLGERQVTAYIGFDPSAASLHVGSLLPVMALVHLQRHGHSPIGIVGGGTGMIGDPSGKSQERLLLTREQIEANLEGIHSQLERFLDFNGRNPARLVNNADWLAPVALLEFLRDVGKYFSVNYMIGKESVRRRMDQEEGISFTEFTYMLLQAYDFLVLYRRYGCVLQMGGSDQWGNITAGIELIRRVEGGRAHGLVFPLVTAANGVKFGKTEAGAVWLDPRMTSPFRFYQFWRNTDDRDVAKYLKYFTLLAAGEIAEMEAALAQDPSRREAQDLLAVEVTRAVHGETELARAQRASQVLFGAEIDDLAAADILDVFADVPSSRLPGARFRDGGILLADLLVEVGLTSSRGEARRLVQGGGLYINNRRVMEESGRISAGDAIEGRVLVLRKGKKDYHVVHLHGG